MKNLVNAIICLFGGCLAALVIIVAMDHLPTMSPWATILAQSVEIFSLIVLACGTVFAVVVNGRD